VVDLLTPTFFKAKASRAWAAWAPYISPPQGHPLAKKNVAREAISAALCTPYNHSEAATAATKELMDFTTVFIITVAIVAYTGVTLEEEMRASPPPSFHRVSPREPCTLCQRPTSPPHGTDKSNRSYRY
jgi:hypothetical protein